MRTAFILLLTLCLCTIVFADNPIIQNNYSADPAPMVYNDTVYLFTSHDEDVNEGFFTMRNWLCYSSTDMVNWTDHGIIASLKNFSWLGTLNNGAWAPQCVYRSGKFYLYVPIQGKGIGVLVSDKPTGPFTDPINKPLVNKNGYYDIDPTVFVDSSGQAYLYWGNPNLYYVKLNANMTSYTGDVVTTALTAAGFGTRSPADKDKPTTYEEGPWFYKRGNLYYMVFAGGPVSEHIGHATSPNATGGPWTYRGVIMPPTISNAAFTNHPGVCDFKGHSYFFYHNQALPGGGGYKRSVCVEQFTYKADGSIPQIASTKNGPDQVGSLNPYDTVQAETICWGQGVETQTCSEGGMNVTSIENGDYIKVKGVDFGTDGATSFQARVASNTSGGKIELHLESATGTLIGTCDVSGTGGVQTWTTKSCNVTGATGKHDLYLKFTGGSGSLFNFNWWKFTGPIVNVNKKQAALIDINPKVSVTHRTGTDATLEIQMTKSLTNGNLKISLFDITGRNINERSVTYANGNKTVSVQFSGVSSGNYFVKVFSGKDLICNNSVVIQ